MTRDLIIGISISLFAHAAFFFSGEIFEKEAPPPEVAEAPPVIELMEMPVFEPEPEILDVSDDAPIEEIPEFAPPMQTDVPSTVRVDSFVQQIQPPPPPGMERPTGVITIPTNSRANFGQGMADLFDLANLDQRPEPTLQSQPLYPFEMRRAGINGQVVVGFIVDSNGNTRDAYAISSTQKEFEAAAIQAVMKWRFRPGRKGGRAVNTRMSVPIVFNITD